jgi:hypothetical protein
MRPPTAAVRRALQHSQKSLNELAEHYGINPKTVAKRKKRSFANDAPMGPKEVRSTVLTEEEEAAIVAFRKYTLLPLDDCLYALRPSVPHLTRSSLHRCLHGISRLPEVEGDKAKNAYGPAQGAPVSFGAFTLGELNAVIRQNGVDFIGHGLGQIIEKVFGDDTCGARRCDPRPQTYTACRLPFAPRQCRYGSTC